MQLFTRYNRINILVMGIVFLLFSISLFFVLNFVLVRELDKDLLIAKSRIQSYTDQYHSLPKDTIINGIHITYELTSQQITPSNFQLVEQYDPIEKQMHNFRKLVYFLRNGQNIYKVRLSIDLERRNHLSRVIAIITILSILIIILALLLTNRIVLKKLWQPFYDAMAVMENFKIGSDQNIEFPKTRVDEFAFMIQNLELSTKKAKEEYHILKQFTENTSHELQTPLAIIRSKLDLLIQDEELTEKQSIIIKSAYTSLKKLSKLNQSLLLLAKIENKQFKKTRYLNLIVLLEEKLEQFHELLKNNNISVTTTFKKKAWINVNTELTDILINNLVSNAIKHNIPGGSITIELDENQLIIANKGQASPLNPNLLFSRFYKESQQGQGVGLGLFICFQICEASGIKIHYEYKEQYHVFTLVW